jgi:hypothetical protein
MAAPLRQMAQEIRKCLAQEDRARGVAEARRLAFSFVETFDRLGPEERVRIVEDRPENVGDVASMRSSPLSPSMSALPRRWSRPLGSTNPAGFWRHGGSYPGCGRFMPTRWSTAPSRSRAVAYSSPKAR